MVPLSVGHEIRTALTAYRYNEQLHRLFSDECIIYIEPKGFGVS